jgi:6-pyruvoyltetrahydropterin/6-carboxytetrahydropterin synthase
MSIVLERLYRFSASHLYRRAEWSDEENDRRFGKCAIPPGHGHNYRLLVRVTGPLEPETGFVVDLALLDDSVRRNVLEPLDHRHLNEAIPEFAPGARIPSSENLVLWVRDRLIGALPEGCRLVGLRLAEDDDLAATWSASGGDALP